MSVTDRWFSSGTSAFPTIETDCYDITEMLLKVALNTINHLTAICNMPMENWNRHINEGTDCIDGSRNISHMHFNVFVPAATCLCLSQALTWICIVIYHGLLYVQLVEGRCDCLFCWYWWDCLPSLLKRFFPHNFNIVGFNVFHHQHDEGWLCSWNSLFISYISLFVALCN